MGSTVKVTASESVLSSSYPNNSIERLVQKTAYSSLGEKNVVVNWNFTRGVTPGGMCGYQNQNGVEFFNFDGDGSIRLFRSGNNSQGLILDGGHVVAASVTSTIQTATNRKNESKGTYVQYDKTRLEQEGADFSVDARNYRGWVNYQGGHLIDHKYSAENSHYVENNYIPAHYFYNAPLKEHLVQGCEAYIEMPLYTPNPPMIGVKGQKDNYHPIPVGIIFIQLNKNEIQDVYYFPNNDFDYKGLKDQLGLQKHLAETIAPYFKLKKSLHPLLRCAMIFQSKSKQSEQEEKFFTVMDDLSWGMSLAECSQEQEILSKLSFAVLHRNYVDPSLCLDLDKKALRELEDQPLTPPFSALGEFLVRYGIRNALKSEVLSVKSRLIFLNVLIDFIEAYTEVSDEALIFIDSLAEPFRSTLDELDRISPTMNQEELHYLANTYQRLSSEFNHVFAHEGHDIFNEDDILNYFKKSIKIMEILTSKYPVKSHEWNYLTFIQEAKGIMNYWIETGLPKEEFQEERAFFKSQKSSYQRLLSKHAKNDNVSVTFQSNINRTTMLKAAPGYLETALDDSESDSDKK